jgi:hypothetical protein
VSGSTTVIVGPSGDSHGVFLLGEVEASTSLNLTAVPESLLPDTRQCVYGLAEPEVRLADVKTET